MPARVLDKSALSRSRSEWSFASPDTKPKFAPLDEKSTFVSAGNGVASASSGSQLPDASGDDVQEQAVAAEDVDRQAASLMMPPWRSGLIIAGLLIGLWMSILDTSIVSTAIWTISEEFGTLGGATWVFVAYTLPYLAFSVIIARVADIVGRKKVVIACYAIFIACSIGCGLSQSLTALIVCRAIQGVGGAGLYSLALVVLPEIAGELEPLNILPFISTLVGFTVALGSCLGPILGGVITENVSWRWNFYINGPIGAVSLIIFWVVWPDKVHVELLGKQSWRNFDFVGAFLVLASSTLFVVGLQEAGIGALPWSSPTIVCTLNYGVLCFFALIGWEFAIGQKLGDGIALMLPLRVITDRVMLAGILCTLFSGFTMLVCIFNIPLRFQFVNLNTPEQAGVHLMPFLGAQALGTVIGGAASMKKNNTFITFLIAAILILVGDGILSTIGNDIVPKTSAFTNQIVGGLGVGMTLSSISLMTSLNVDFRDHAVTQGLAAQVRMLGGTIGIAASTAVFNRQLHTKLKDLLTPDQINGIQTSFGQITKTFNATQLEAVRETFASSFSETLRVCTYVAVFGVIAAAATWQLNPTSIARRKLELVTAMRELHEQTAAAETTQRRAMV